MPSEVVDINWKAINSTSVQVSWKAPRKTNGILKNYTLFYTQDSNLPLDAWSIKQLPASIHATQVKFKLI